ESLSPQPQHLVLQVIERLEWIPAAHLPLALRLRRGRGLGLDVDFRVGVLVGRGHRRTPLLSSSGWLHRTSRTDSCCRTWRSDVAICPLISLPMATSLRLPITTLGR